MADKFSIELHSSVQNRMLRYDGHAAAESTTQSRLEYLRRRDGSSSRPRWLSHVLSDDKTTRQSTTTGATGASTAAAVAAASASAPFSANVAVADAKEGAKRSASATVLFRQPPAPSLAQRLASEQRAARALPPASSCHNASPPRAACPSLSRAAMATNNKEKDSGDVEPLVEVWSHHGKQKKPASLVPGVANKSVVVSSSSSTEHRSVAASSYYSYSSGVPAAAARAFAATPTGQFGIAVKRRQPFEGELPVSVGDILGKNDGRGVNITHAQKTQRERYERLERERLAAMKHELDSKGWAPEVKPGGADKRVDSRSDLMGNLSPAANRIYIELKERRKVSPLSKRDVGM